MKNFYMKFLVKGSMIILGIIVVWFIYFIINFINPHFFDFLRQNNKNLENISTSTPQTKKSLNYRIYDMFFKSRSTAENTSTTEKEAIKKKSFWDSTSTVVWGVKDTKDSKTNVWGGNINSQNSLEGMTFINPNNQKSPIKEMKINTLLVNENNFNYLPDGAIISGLVYSGFLNGYYFNAEIYSYEGELLFSIPITLNLNFNDAESFSNFYGTYNKNLNFTNYKGKAYMIIKSDNASVSGAVLIKIELK